VPGWASLFVAVLLLGGVQLVCLGLLGEYIGRIYTALQDRPTYLVAYDSAESSTESSVESSGLGGAPGAPGAPGRDVTILKSKSDN
jgi:dolichol-phosphate mannosyltransferase